MNDLMKQEEGIVVYDRIGDPIEAATRMGEFFARSGMFGCEKVEQGQVLALACMAERKSPFEILRNYHLIGGRLSMRADAMLALYRQHGGKVQWLEVSDKCAKGRWIYDGNDLTLAYTIEEARAAGYVRPNSTWIKNPGSMLRARLISAAVRMLCPEAIVGVYTPEEISEINTPAPAKELLPEKKVVEILPPAPAQPAPVKPAPAQTEAAEAVVLPTTLEELEATHEAKLNGYLLQLKWIAPDETWRDLDEPHRKAVEKKFAGFAKKVMAFND